MKVKEKRFYVTYVSIH